MEAPEDLPDPLVGQVLDGRYQLTGRLARGGMGTVYTAVDQRLDRPVAVKVMHPRLAEDPDFVARFIREARSAARLNAPEVVAVYDTGRDPATGAAYLVMEHVQGRDLRTLLSEQGALSPAHALAVLEPVLRALAAAHRAGLVHRDVKPENVLLADDGRVKVADFGLARAVEASEHTATTGLLLGTVAYLAPEQVEQGRSDARSDVYAAGIVLWEALTGAPPYASAHPLTVAYHHVHDDVPPPSRCVAGVPAALDELVVRATRRDPSQRPADAGEFLAEVRGVRAQLPAAASRADTLVAPRTETFGAPRAETFRAPLAETFRAPPAETFRAPPAETVVTRRAETLVVPLADTSAAPGADGFAKPRNDTRAAARADTLVAPVAANTLVVPPLPATAAGGGSRRDTAPQSARRRRRWPRIVVLLGLLLGLVAAGGGWYLGSGRWTTAPAVLTLPAADARQKLQAAGLQAVTGSPARYDEQVPAGRVLDQQPDPGGRVRKGGAVTVVLSKGPDRREVPDTLVGASQDRARRALEAVGLRAGTVTSRFSPRPKGTVLRTDPSAGTALRPGSAVALVVSKGLELLPVPAVAGKPQAAAEAALEQAGLTSKVQLTFHDTVPAGTVVEQSPARGTAPRGSTVSLTVSKGPDLVPVPDLSGLTRPEAERLLADTGLQPGALDLPDGAGQVVTQSPAAGTQVPRGSAVTFYVL